MKKCFAAMLALALSLTWSVAALADAGYDFDATVVCVQPEYVFAAIGGTVASVPVLQGQRVAKGDVLAELKTAKVYAGVDGTVTGVFCEPGDSISDITKRFGALMYIEPDSKYTVTASTEEAYNLSANKYIHVGETVYLECSNGKHTGTGLVTAVKGTDFTVEITDGGFYMGETVSVYRNKSHTAKSRIGKGDIARTENVAVTGSENGSVAALHATDGKRVHAGDLLLETLSGEYDARYCTGSALTAGQDGILASLNVQVGGSVNKGDVIATLYPTSGLQLEVKLNEADLAALPVDTPVSIRFSWSEDLEDAPTYTGTVTRVLYATAASTASSSGSANAGSGSNAGTGTEQKTDSSSSAGDTFSAYIDFEADDTVRLGMTATVRTLGGEDEEEDAEEDAEGEAEEAEAPEAEASIDEAQTKAEASDATPGNDDRPFSQGDGAGGSRGDWSGERPDFEGGERPGRGGETENAG